MFVKGEKYRIIVFRFLSMKGKVLKKNVAPFDDNEPVIVLDLKEFLEKQTEWLWQ